MALEREDELRRDLNYRPGTHPRFWSVEEVKKLFAEIDRLRVNEHIDGITLAKLSEENTQLREKLAVAVDAIQNLENGSYLRPDERDQPESADVVVNRFHYNELIKALAKIRGEE